MRRQSEKLRNFPKVHIEPRSLTRKQPAKISSPNILIDVKKKNEKIHAIAKSRYLEKVCAIYVCIYIYFRICAFPHAGRSPPRLNSRLRYIIRMPYTLYTMIQICKSCYLILAAAAHNIHTEVFIIPYFIRSRNRMPARSRRRLIARVFRFSECNKDNIAIISESRRARARLFLNNAPAGRRRVVGILFQIRISRLTSSSRATGFNPRFPAPRRRNERPAYNRERFFF